MGKLTKYKDSFSVVLDKTSDTPLTIYDPYLNQRFEKVPILLKVHVKPEHISVEE